MPNVLAIVLLVMASLVQAAPVPLAYELLDSRPHPNLAFTQGLIISGDEFIESSGGYGKSFIQRYPISTESSLAPTLTHLPRKDFAEGLALANQQLWLLTWRQGIAKRLAPDDFSLQALAQYKGEGWGLTWAKQAFIMSDGSHTLTWRDSHFAPLKSLPVTLAGKPLNRLNELEFARGLIWANIWFDNRMVAIHPNSGAVVAVVDLSDLVAAESRLHWAGLPQEATLNGIAYHSPSDTFWVTGKKWRKLYRIKLPSTDSLLNN